MDTWRGRSKSAVLLLSSGAEVDARDIKLQTPLICASRAGNGNEVGLLLQAGADVNARDSMGRTALFHANNFPVVTNLIQNQADINGCDNLGLHVVDHALARYKEERDEGFSTEESKKVINYLLSQKPKLSFSTRMAAFYHLNRRKIWVSASAFCASAVIGTYLYKKNPNLIQSFELKNSYVNTKVPFFKSLRFL